MSDSDYVQYFDSSLFAISTTYKFRERDGEGGGEWGFKLLEIGEQGAAG